MFIAIVVTVVVVFLLIVVLSYVQRRNTEKTLYNNNMYSNPTQTTDQASSPQSNMSNEIAELNKMLKEGKITEMEYARMKYKIINGQ